MRYAILLLAVSACSTPKEQGYAPNKLAVQLNNKALDLMMHDPFSNEIDTSTVKKAIMILDSALEIDKKNSVIYSNRHDAMVKLGRFDDAIETLKMSIINIENFAEGYMGLGMLNEHLNNQDQAHINYIKAIENYELRIRTGTDEQRIHSHCEIAFIKAFLGKKEEALRDLNNLLYRNRGNSEIQFYIETVTSIDKNQFIIKRFTKF